MDNKINFTKEALNKLPLPLPGKRTYWNDKKIQGLQLVMYSSGQKSFVVYRKIDGKPTRYKLGSYPTLTVEKARKKAQIVLGEIESGKNPQKIKRAKLSQSVTLIACFNFLLDTRKSLKPKTQYDYTRLIEAAFSDWKNKLLTDISKEMVLRRHQNLGSNSGPYYANQAMRLLRSIFNLARDYYEDANGDSFIKTNPVNQLTKARAWFPEKRRHTLIKSHQLEAWFDAVLEQKEVDDNAKTVSDYLITLLLTGLRRQEAAKLAWNDVDMLDRTLVVRDTKNHDDHTLPIPDYLFSILKERKKTSVNEYVFSGKGGTGHLIEPRRQIEKIINKSNVEFSIHDLRRTFATNAENLEVSAYALKRLLNHKMKNDVTAGYIVTDVEKLRGPIQRIENFVLHEATKTSQCNKVIPIKRKGTIT